MIFIKRKLLCIILTAAVIFLSGCAAAVREPTYPNLELSGAECRIEYGGKTCTARITNSSGGITSISFGEPESLQGVIYTFSPDKCTITLDDLSFSAENSRLGRRAVPQLLRDILRDASNEDSLTTEESEDDNALFSGQLNGSRYTIKSNALTGELCEIACRDLGIKAVFQSSEETSDTSKK